MLDQIHAYLLFTVHVGHTEPLLAGVMLLLPVLSIIGLAVMAVALVQGSRSKPRRIHNYIQRTRR